MKKDKKTPEFLIGENDLKQIASLQESDKYLKDFLHWIPVNISMLEGEDLIVRMINPTALSHMGKTEAETLNHSIRDLMPEFAERHKLLLEVMRTGIPYSAKEAEIKFNHSGKENSRYYDVNYTPWIDLQGKIKGVMCVAVEVTEKVLARKKIEEHAKELNLFFKQVPASLVVFEGPEHVFTLANDIYLERYQKREKEVIGRSLKEVYPELEGQQVYNLIHGVYTTGVPVIQNEVPYYLKVNGELKEFYTDIVFQPFRNEQGEIVSVMAFGVEVTEQVLIRRRLEQNQQELQELVKQASVSITMFEGEELRVKVVNKAALETIGKTEEEVLNKTYDEFFPELTKRINIYLQVLKTGIPYEGKEVEIAFNRFGKPYKGYYDLNYNPWYDLEGKVKGVISIGVEVTEKILARKKIEESENRFRTVLKISPIPIGFYMGESMENMIVHTANDAFFNLLEMTPDILGKPLLEVFPTAKQHPLFDMMQDVFLNDKIIELTEYPATFTRKDGTQHSVYFNVKYQPFKEADGTIKGILASGYDVTTLIESRKKIEESHRNLELANEQLEATFASVPSAIYQFTPLGQVLYLNKRGAELLGFNTPEEFFEEKDMEQLRQRLILKYESFEETGEPANPLNSSGAIAIRTGEKFEKVIRYIYKPTNETFWMLSSAIPVKDDKGEIVSVIAIATDITAQRNFTEKLEEQVAIRTAELENTQSFLEQIIDSSVEFISVLDKDFLIITVNKKFEEYVQATRDELIGKSLLEVNPKLVNTDYHEAMQNALKGKTVHLDRQESLTYPHRYFDMYYIPLKIKGKIEGIIIMSRNITDIVHSEMLLAQKNKALEQSNKELESFNYIASHDLQEPLRKIQSFIDRIQHRNTDKESRELYLTKIDEAARRMRELILSVLSYSQISINKEDYTKVDLNKIITGIIQDFELLIEEKHAIIQCEPLPTIKANALHMNQLFSNLISNSLKFSSQNPKITISSKIVSGQELTFKEGVNPKIEYIQITFSDNGIGFDEKYKEQIFTLFYRLHGKQEYAGTGIGLSIVKKIIEHHKGFISVDSHLNEGAVFTIWLPK